MDSLKAPSLQSLLESDRGSTDSLLAESLQLDIDDIDDVEYSIPALANLPTLESILNEFDGDSDINSELAIPAPTPTPSIPEEGSKGGCILRHVLLQGVSTQIASAADRINAGFATAVAVSHLIAVGTSHGHVLNFDTSQTLRWAHQDSNSQGAVSALAYNEDSSRLLIGFAGGLIVMIDTKVGDVLRNLFDSITPNTGVLNLKWTGKPALALGSDSGGSVWSLSFTRKLGIRGCSSRCLFSGARGEVCEVEPLLLPDNNNELSQYTIVALATLSKFFVVTIRPRLKVIKFRPLSGPPDCLPLLAWQMVLIQAADRSRTIDPVLAVARGNQLYFHQIFISNGRVSLLYLRHVQLSTNLMSLHWLGPKSITYLDTNEMLHLIEVRSNAEQESVDMANVGLVYGSAQFKGLATGGNVSPALALAGKHACYNSVISRGNQLYILGARSLHMVTVRTWNEQISYFVGKQRWVDACSLAIDGYKMVSDRPKRQAQYKDRIIKLFNEYISFSNRAPEFCLGPMMKCLIEIQELDLLWQELWDRLNSPSLFLTLVTEHIENDEITVVSPSISQALVDFWINLSPEKLEEVILKLDWTCLDLDQVLKAIKRKTMYKAQIHLNTVALKDYIVSLTDLIPQIESDEGRNLGNCLLVYISSCLAGRGYPKGDIPIDRVQNVKEEVFMCLTSIHSSNSEINELPYPYLRALLNFDTRETLNVISLAFEEEEFNGDNGLMHRKTIINILLEIIVNEGSPWSQIGCLLNFISQQISSKSLSHDPVLLEKIVNYLSMPEIDGETVRQHSERENAWLELLAMHCLDHIPLDVQIMKAKQAKCFYVVEHILEITNQYDTILSCYLNNSHRNDEMFEYIKKNALIPERKIYNQILENIKVLLEINSETISKIVSANYEDKIDELIDKLLNESKLLFNFLSHLIQFGVSLNSKNCEFYIELLCIESPENLNSFLKKCDNYRIDRALEIVKTHNLMDSRIFLHEKQGDFQLAFELSLNQLVQVDRNESELIALRVISFCSRASKVLSETEREEIWFALLNQILLRTELKGLTKPTLHEASQYVDLSNLIQLVLNSGTKTGSFGDIKDLIMGMLTNARFETLAMESTAKILGNDLHVKFAKKRTEARRGFWVSIVKCVICRQRLNNQSDVIVLIPCGHAMHITCQIRSNESTEVETVANDSVICPRCSCEIPGSDASSLAEPSLEIIDRSRVDPPDPCSLNVKAPPRMFSY